MDANTQRALRHAGCCAAFATLLWPLDATAQVLFAQDYSAAAEPNAGFDGTRDEALGTSYLRHRVPGAGPSGQDAYRLEWLFDPSKQSPEQSWGGQFDLGWTYDAGEAVAQGSVRYVRFKLKFSSDTNFRGRDWSETGTSPVESGMQNKLFILAGGHQGARTIVSTRGSAGGSTFRLIVSRGGGDDANIPDLPVGVWHDIQVEMQSSSTADASDGRYRIWLDNPDYDAADATSDAFPLSTDGWSYIALGFFSNHGIDTTGVHDLQITDFVFRGSFDGSTDGGTGGGGSEGGAGSGGQGTAGQGTSGIGAGGSPPSGPSGSGGSAGGDGGDGGDAAAAVDDGCAIRSSAGSGACAGILVALTLLATTRRRRRCGSHRGLYPLCPKGPPMA